MNFDPADIFSRNTMPQMNSEELQTSLQKKVEASRWCLGFVKNFEFSSVATTGYTFPPTEGFEGFDRSSSPISTSPTTLPSNLQRANNGFVLLPANGNGWVRNPGTYDSGQWGLPTTIQAIVAIAAAWQSAGNAPLVIGDMSLQTGGPFPPHHGHNTGMEVDIRYITIGPTSPGTWRTSNYSRSKTVEFIKLIKANGVLPVRQLFFNDPYIISQGLSTHAEGHDNHIHVTFG